MPLRSSSSSQSPQLLYFVNDQNITTWMIFIFGSFHNGCIQQKWSIFRFIIATLIQNYILSLIDNKKSQSIEGATKNCQKILRPLVKNRYRIVVPHFLLFQNWVEHVAIEQRGDANFEMVYFYTYFWLPTLLIK